MRKSRYVKSIHANLRKHHSGNTWWMLRSIIIGRGLVNLDAYHGYVRGYAYNKALDKELIDIKMQEAKEVPK